MGERFVRIRKNIYLRKNFDAYQDHARRCINIQFISNLVFFGSQFQTMGCWKLKTIYGLHQLNVREVGKQDEIGKIFKALRQNHVLIDFQLLQLDKAWFALGMTQRASGHHWRVQGHHPSYLVLNNLEAHNIFFFEIMLISPKKEYKNLS